MRRTLCRQIEYRYLRGVTDRGLEKIFEIATQIRTRTLGELFTEYALNALFDF